MEEESEKTAKNSIFLIQYFFASVLVRRRDFLEVKNFYIDGTIPSNPDADEIGEILLSKKYVLAKGKREVEAADHIRRDEVV